VEDLPLQRKNREHQWAPIIADQTRARNLVFRKKLWSIEILDVLVVKDDVVIIPEHLVVKTVGVKDQPDSYEYEGDFRFRV